MSDRGAFQIDLGIVLSSVGAHSDNDKEQFNGLFSFSGIDFGLYIGPSFNPFQTIGPSIGAGLLIGQNGFLAGKIGIHYRRKYGLALLFPIMPIYGAAAASFLSMLPIAEEIKMAAAIPLLVVPAAVFRTDFLKRHEYVAEKIHELKASVNERIHLY